MTTIPGIYKRSTVRKGLVFDVVVNVDGSQFWSRGHPTVDAALEMRLKMLSRYRKGQKPTKAKSLHGLTGSPTYHAWSSMIQRCTNPRNPRFGDWGGRGVTVCARWLPRAGGSFDNFFADTGTRPEGLTLDRIDNDGNYEPGNCRWATRSQQQRNQRARARAET